jgi:hypothetical protein
VVTFSIERHVLLQEIFLFIFGFGGFFILKVIQARLICTCLIQKKASKLVVPASQIHVTSVFRIATSSFSYFFSYAIPAARKKTTLFLQMLLQETGTREENRFLSLYGTYGPQTRVLLK